jgi:hypothetical protein
MKSLSNGNCNIAVCFSGQSRTFKYCAKSINSFFSSNKGNKYHFFGHTWDTNLWKTRPDDNIVIENERIDDIAFLEKEIKESFNFKKLVVEKEIYRPYPWASVLYSTMRSNFLKQQYEAENNMMFDLVIKARFDIFYPRCTMFEDMFRCSTQEKTIYSHKSIMEGEFFLPNINDVIYCGSSLSMDLLDSLYNQLMTKSFDKLVGTNYDNPAYSRVGPGVMLYKWGSMKNLIFCHNHIHYAAYRKSAIGMNTDTDFEEIRDIGSFLNKR